MDAAEEWDEEEGEVTGGSDEFYCELIKMTHELSVLRKAAGEKTEKPGAEGARILNDACTVKSRPPSRAHDNDSITSRKSKAVRKKMQDLMKRYRVALQKVQADPSLCELNPMGARHRAMESMELGEDDSGLLEQELELNEGIDNWEAFVDNRGVVDLHSSDGDEENESPQSACGTPSGSGGTRRQKNAAQRKMARLAHTLS